MTRKDRKDCSPHLTGADVEVLELLNEFSRPVASSVPADPGVIHHLGELGRPNLDDFEHSFDQIPLLQLSLNAFDKDQNGFHLVLNCQQKIVQ